MADTIDPRVGNDRRKQLLQMLLQQAQQRQGGPTGLGANAAGFGLAVAGGLRALPVNRMPGLNFTHQSRVAAQFLPGLGGAVGRQGDAGHSSPAPGTPVPTPGPSRTLASAAAPADAGTPAGMISSPPPPATISSPPPEMISVHTPGNIFGDPNHPFIPAGSTPTSGASAQPVPLGNNTYYNPQTGQVVTVQPGSGMWAA